jgi:acetyl-CoA acetyltransferase
MNVARIGALLAGLPDSVAAQTINRFCSSACRRWRSRPTASAWASAS